MPGLTAALLINTSGLQAQSVRAASTAHNIANAGTNGYKRVDTQFSSQVAGNYPNGVVARPRLEAGGQSFIAPTGNNGDLAVSGNGYFVVSDQPSGGELRLTRAGSFRPDGDGYLRNAQGFYLQGFGPGGGNAAGDLGPIRVNDTANATGVDISPDGTVSALLEDGSSEVIGQVPLATVPGQSGLGDLSGTVFQTTADSGEFQLQAPGIGGAGQIVPGGLESADVNLSEEAANLILTKQAYTASARAFAKNAELTQTLVDVLR